MLSLENLISAVVGAFVVWMFNEIAKKFQMNRERRAHVGRALSNLLELHHRIRAMEDSTHLIMSHFALSKDQEPAMRVTLEQVIPQSEEYLGRYEDAIELLSESEPLIAFDLRTKAQIPRLLTTLRTMGANQGATEVDMVFFEKQFKRMIIPHLEAAIMILAKLHGKSTLRQVNSMLNAPIEMPDEFIQKALAANSETPDNTPTPV